MGGGAVNSKMSFCHGVCQECCIGETATGGRCMRATTSGVTHRDCTRSVGLAYYANLSCTEIAMPTRNVVLTDHQAALVEHLVASGRYQNASEVLREGLRLVEQREAEDAARLEALRAAAKAGIADIEAGRYKAFDTRESLRAHLKAVTAQTLAQA